MGKEELLEYVNLFREKAEQNKLVIFVGAGVSCNVDGMPSWNDLITEMAKSIGYTKCSTCKHKEDNCSDFCKLKYDFTTDEYLKIPQYVYNHDEHGVELFYDILKKNIDSSAIDAPLSSAIPCASGNGIVFST